MWEAAERCMLAVQCLRTRWSGQRSAALECSGGRGAGRSAAVQGGQPAIVNGGNFCNKMPTAPLLLSALLSLLRSTRHHPVPVLSQYPLSQ